MLMLVIIITNVNVNVIHCNLMFIQQIVTSEEVRHLELSH